MIRDNRYTFDGFSKMILTQIKSGRFYVIGITGPSCVGKSTLADCIRTQQIQCEQKICVLQADNYLIDTYRGKNGYLVNYDSILDPKIYDWKLMNAHILKLSRTKDVKIRSYTRGEGWGRLRKMEASDIMIVEGLFLDSVEAMKYLSLDLLIVLKADRDLLYANRVQRDLHYNSLYPVFRTEQQSRTEAFRTFYADKFYKRAKLAVPYLKMKITDSHEMELFECHDFPFVGMDWHESGRHDV